MRRVVASAVAMVALVVPLSGFIVSSHQKPGGGDGDFLDSEALPLEAGTVIRQDGQPAVDTRSDVETESVSLRTDVLFEFGSAELTPDADAVLNIAVDQIRQLSPERLVITGHTDSIGDDASNQTLSEQRAAAVETAVRERLGPDGPPTEVEGRGESEPIAPNELPGGGDNPEGRALNRRVEIEVES